jgi:hypothetical protein
MFYLFKRVQFIVHFLASGYRFAKKRLLLHDVVSLVLFVESKNIWKQNGLVGSLEVNKPAKWYTAKME